MGELQQELIARWRALRDDRRIWAVACGCLAIATALVWWRMGTSHAPPPPARASAPPIDAVTTVPPRSSLVLDVVGAVHRPGIVHVDAGARVADAIGAAGGATADADLVRLNLAAPVADGARIAVPKVGAPAPALDGGAITGGPPDPASGGTASGPVNVNTATAAQLDALPGIGPATAAAIVREREQHGPFRSADDLGRVRGIGPAKLAQLHDLVAV